MLNYIHAGSHVSGLTFFKLIVLSFIVLNDMKPYLTLYFFFFTPPLSLTFAFTELTVDSNYKIVAG